MYPVIIFCGVAPFFLVHFADCSSHRQNKFSIHQNISTPYREHHENPQKVVDIAVHGILLWAAVGLLMPLGVLTMRMSSSSKDCHPFRHKILFYVHAVFQALSVIIATIGAVLSIRKFENVFNNTHQRVGIGLYGAIYLQFLIGFRRPKRGTRARSSWYFLHWILGTTTCLVGTLNIYTGLQAYHKRTSKSTTLWTVILTAQVFFMTIFYLFQDKWDYIQKQGMMIMPRTAPNSSQLPQLENQREAMNEQRRKGSTLGTSFLRNNALNRLFQST